MKNKIAVIGIGHPVRGDDALGPIVIEKLKLLLPQTIYMVSLLGDLAELLSLFEDYPAIFLIDALMTPKAMPGEIFRFTSDTMDDNIKSCRTSTHAFDLAQTLAMARNLGVLPETLVIYGMQAAQFSHGEDLSPAMQDNLPKFINEIYLEIASLI